MASIRETRKKLMPAVIALAVLDLVCVGYLFSPAGRTRQARQREYQQLHQQLVAKQQEVLPTRGMDQKLTQIEADLEQKLAQIEADKTRIETTLRAYCVALEMVISDMANGASMEEACHKHGIPIPRTALQ